MANRIVKEGILRSDKVNSLSWTAEVFYRRLMSVADDFGRFDARLPIVRSALYPLRLDRVSEADIVKWMNECSEAGLISQYEVDNKPYMEIIEFGQTLRIKKSKYPCKQTQADASRCVAEKNPNPKQESETEIESEKKTPASFDSIYSEMFNSESWLNAICIQKKIFPAEISKHLEEFLGDIKLKEDWHKGLKEVKEHFINWLNLRLKEKSNGSVTSAVSKY